MMFLLCDKKKETIIGLSHFLLYVVFKLSKIWSGVCRGENAGNETWEGGGKEERYQLH